MMITAKSTESSFHFIPAMAFCSIKRLHKNSQSRSQPARLVLLSCSSVCSSTGGDYNPCYSTAKQAGLPCSLTQRFPVPCLTKLWHLIYKTISSRTPRERELYRRNTWGGPGGVGRKRMLVTTALLWIPPSCNSAYSDLASAYS